MYDLNSEGYALLEQKRGEPFIINKNGTISKLNQQYFAAYVQLTHLMIHYPPDKCFYVYRDDSGVWANVDGDGIESIVLKTLNHYAKVQDIRELLACYTSSFLSSVSHLLKKLAVVDKSVNFFEKKEHVIHCANTMLVYDEKLRTWEQKDFSPAYHSRNQIPIMYDPAAGCPRFLNDLLAPAMTQDDIDVIQIYFGQCLLGHNSSQTFLLILGEPGTGKSMLANIIEMVIGDQNFTELRLGHIGGRFETSAFRGKNLLVGKDVRSDFLCEKDAGMIKSLTGGDSVMAELKNSNLRHEVTGNFNVIIVGNPRLRIAFDEDVGAWRRRLLLTRYHQPASMKRVADLDKVLFDEEKSGILNWALEGASKLLANGGLIERSAEQQARVDDLIAYSKPFDAFGRNHINPNPNTGITTDQAVTSFFRFCKRSGWEGGAFTPAKVQRMFHEWMGTTFNAVPSIFLSCGQRRRGYFGFQIVES